MSELIKIDEEYAKWISDISKRIRQSQLKAAVKVNDEMLRFLLATLIHEDTNDKSEVTKVY